MKKPIFTLILCAAILFASAAYADETPVTVTVQGEKLETPIAPQIVNDRTMLPMRSIFEKLGADVTWAADDQMIFAVKDDTFITLKIGFNAMSVQTAGKEGNTSVFLETAPYLQDDYTFVPVRAVAEAFNAKVDWIGETKTVVITTD